MGGLGHVPGLQVDLTKVWLPYSEMTSCLVFEEVYFFSVAAWRGIHRILSAIPVWWQSDGSS